ncbi:Fcf1-domain-containing protein [Cantharellus anzutake]|uniref:Fcf1-domain-containing protein n=1 Tax=Cantharellus anzutake TaxID=1750568 RepID=UPI001905B6E1|nr:Fcf1-domain-containing protein [Cantharellus anzutake]KAF8341295.1 Fcf1-domain-containing protein [Cantharellus anzutake]
MRERRAKIYKKIMNMYRQYFGFRDPYQVLTDSTFCIHGYHTQYNLQKCVETVLRGDARLMITRCSMARLYRLGDKGQGQPIIRTAKGFELWRCDHQTAINEDECIKSIIGTSNERHCCVATVNKELFVALRRIAGVPVIHFNKHAMVLGRPSNATLSLAVYDESGLRASEAELAMISRSNKPQELEEERRKVATPKKASNNNKKTRKPKLRPAPRPSVKTEKDGTFNNNNTNGLNPSDAKHETVRLSQKRPLSPDTDEDEGTGKDAGEGGTKEEEGEVAGSGTRARRGHRKKHRRKGKGPRDATTPNVDEKASGAS